MCAIESSRRHKCIILEQHAITSPHNFSAVCSVEEKKKRNQCKDDGGGGDLLTGQEEQTVCSISLHQLWMNPSNRERRLSTTENIHLPLYRIFPSPSLPHYSPLLPNVVLLPTGPTLHPDCFSKVKPTQSGKIKGFLEERFCWRVRVLWYSRWPLQALDCR